jgi:alpha-D-xyloside xylohydrolase
VSALYEDKNTSSNYEKGAYAFIPFNYIDATKTLLIAARNGQFKGMIEKRTFNIAFVTPDKSGKLKFVSTPDRIITYDGTEQKIIL